MQEEWRPVVGYEGLYEVSNTGKVKRVSRHVIDKTGHPCTYCERVLKEDKKHTVPLSGKGKPVFRPVRSIVAEAFLGLPYGTDISHIDRDIGNASVANLISTDEYRKMDPDWRDIPGWEGVYQVSRFGDIRSLDRHYIVKGGYRFFAGKVKSKAIVDGHYVVELHSPDRNTESRLIEYYVAAAWLPNTSNLKYVRHIDNDRFNNNVDNLEWCTHEEKYPSMHARSYTYDPVRCIETGVEYPSCHEAGEAIGVTASCIRFAIAHKSSSGGYHFVKANEKDFNFGIEPLEGEVWKDIIGYEGRYMMSNKKRIKTVQRPVSCRWGTRISPEKLIASKTIVDSEGKSHTINIDAMYNMLFSN